MKAIAQPLTLFLIGATGDLAKKKILKALYQLYVEHLLPERFLLIGNSRKEMSQLEFQTWVHSIVDPKNTDEWTQFSKSLNYVSGDASEPHTIEKIKAFHANVTACGNHLWYIATLPSLYTNIIRNIETAGLHHTQCGWTKVMLEKPFGMDVTSAHELNQLLMSVFDEDHVYRIDHFLAKETVQNLLVFRFANGLFEHLWNKNFVDHIQITAAETLGVEGREVFYDQTGTIRDVIQNHVIQMLATALMEEPASLNALDIRMRREETIEHFRPFSPENIAQHVRFGQYGEGNIDGQHVPAYLTEKNMPPQSRTETAVAFRTFVDTDRWQNVPIYVLAGKRLERTVTEISIVFKEPRNSMFRHMPQRPNILNLRIQPNEGVVVRIHVKKPGLQLDLEEVPMQFCYKSEFQMDLIEAYVKLIYDAVQGDPTLFPKASSIEASWRFVQPLLEYKTRPDFRAETYAAGSWGPKSFQELIAEDKRSWIQPSVEVCNI